MGVGRNWLQWGFSVRRVRFVFLAGCASVYVFFGEFFHLSAFVCLAEEVDRVRNAGMTGERVVVI